MPCQNIGVVAGSGGDFLPLLDLRKRAQKIAVGGGLFIALGVGSVLHARLQTLDQIVTAAFEKHFRISSSLSVKFIGGESRRARTQAAANVVLQAGPGMRPRQVHRAGRNAKRLVNEMDDAVSQAVRKIRAKVD